MPLKRSLSPAAAGLAKTPHKRTRPSSSAPAHDVPTPKECEAVHDALIAVHGEPPAQQAVKFEDDEEGAPGTDRGTCTSVLDSVFRCMLTLNTNARNYRIGKKGLDERFGRGNYEAIRQAPLEAVVEALRPGGLANVKGKRLKRMLDDVYARNEPKELSLEDLYDLPSDKVKETLLSLHGVGPKVAACVMSYRLGLHEFAVDTHVLRITKSLGWVSQKSNAQQAYVHLNARIPNALKHNLHVLFIQHGRACRTCAAAGVRVKDSIEQCPLKPFFRS
ncbi:hypothetical protein JCM10450v2_002264 [Rhodotorula kratochvilovae]